MAYRKFPLKEGLEFIFDFPMQLDNLNPLYGGNLSPSHYYGYSNVSPNHVPRSVNPDGGSSPAATAAVVVPSNPAHSQSANQTTTDCDIQKPTGTTVEEQAQKTPETDGSKNG